MASELGVQTIQHTNGTDAMTIDSSGRVKQPALPAWSAYNSTGSYVALPVTPLILNSTEVNRGNMYSTSTGIVTIPISGVYSITAMVYARVANSETFALRIEKSTDSGTTWNMQTYAYSEPSGITSEDKTMVNSIYLDLDANDQLRIRLTGSGDYYSGSQETRFSGHLIG